MSCERFESELVELARADEGFTPARGVDVLAHAKGCPRCSARLEDERAVTSALRALAARTAGAEAPPRVEAALLRAMREPATETGATPAVRAARIIELLLFAAAAAILAAIVIVPPRMDPFPPAAPATIPTGSPMLASGPMGAGEDAEFVALSYGQDLGELDSLQIMSVELPRTALTALGWPAEDGARVASVKAEVIVGHDGVARAIRFVE